MTTFTINDIPLTDFGKVTLLDEYLDFPPRRGMNQTIPFQHGTAFSAKYFDEREINIQIAIVGDDAADLESLLDDLRALLAPRTQLVLEATLEDTSVRNISVSLDRPLSVVRRSDKIATVVITFTAARPFWRSIIETAEDTVISVNPTALNITNGGTVEERNPTIVLTGPLTNLVITNTTNNIVMYYNAEIVGGETVTITTNSWGEYTATSTAGGGTNVIGNVTHNGAAALMVLDVGVNELSITSDVTSTGTVELSFYPPYL